MTYQTEQLTLEEATAISAEVMKLKPADVEGAYVVYTPSTNTWEVAGMKLGDCIKRRYEEVGQYSSRRRTGKVRLIHKCDDWRAPTSLMLAKQFPQRRDGTHNYAAIAERLVEDARWRARRALQDERRSRNEPICHRVAVALGFGETDARQGYIRSTDDPEKPVRVKVAIDRNMTEEDALHLLRFLKAGELLR